MKLLLLFCIFCIFTPVRWVLAAEPLSLSVQEAPVRDVLQSMAQMAGRNLVLDSQIPGTLSLEIQQLPFPQALEMVTRSQGLCFREEGNTLWVASPERMDALYGRLTVHPLEYISARETAETLKPLFSAPLAWSRDANAILFHGSPGEENRLKEALQALDRPTRQITLEARILSLGESASRELGLQWDWSALPEGRKKGEGGFGGRLHLGHSYGASFQARLSALCQEGKAKVLATPRIITLPGREASIFIGDHIPVVTEKVTNSTFSSPRESESMVPGVLSTVTPCFSASPLRGLIWASKPTGSSMRKPVGMSLLSKGRSVTDASRLARRSIPALCSVA